jgi:hypothetical protein
MGTAGSALDGSRVAIGRNDGGGDERAVFVYTTRPALVEAEHAARALVTPRLAACVNIAPETVSHYRGEGKLKRGEEVVGEAILPMLAGSPRRPQLVTRTPP